MIVIGPHCYESQMNAAAAYIWAHRNELSAQEMYEAIRRFCGGRKV